MLTTPARSAARYDAPAAFVALIRHELAATFAAHKRACAVAIVATADGVDAWTLLAAECEGLGPRQSDTYGKVAMTRVCELMAKGRADQGIAVLAGYCGESADEWQRRAMAAMSAGRVSA